MELLEIEKELTGPDKDAALARYDRVLVELQARLDRALREGLAPDDFVRCEGLPEVVTLARKLMRLQMRGEQAADVTEEGGKGPDWQNMKDAEVRGHVERFGGLWGR